MATKRTTKSAAPEAQQPINRYGCKILGKDQFFYDRWAFTWRKQDNDAPCRLDLFKRIAKRINPTYFEWHPWADKMVEAVCEERWVGVAGCSGCVRGDTRLYDPVTGEQPTIQELCGKGIAPTVMTLQGPERAEVPFVKGVADIFELRLDNGATLYATAEHRVLVSHANATKWCPVGSLKIGQSLLSYEPCLPQSNSARDLSTRGTDVPCFQKTIEGSQGHCSAYSRHDGAPLPLEVDSAPPLAPLLSGVLPRIHWNYNVDARDFSGRCTHFYSQCAPPSMTGLVRRRSSSCIHALCQQRPKTYEHGESWCESGEQFHLAGDLLGQALAPIPGCACRHWGNNGAACFSQSTTNRSLSALDSSRCFQQSQEWLPQRSAFEGFGHGGSHTDWESCDIDSILRYLRAYNLKVALSKVVSIRNAGKTTFYDITVPAAGHYFAEGTIHHNSAKTHNISGFACVWWLCNPMESSVIFCSTTAKALRRRGWAQVSRFRSTIPGPPLGNFVNSQMVWRAEPGDDKHAIIGIAVEEGQTDKVADNIKGIHTTRQMVIIDEATAVPPAIFDAVTNLYTYPQDNGGEFILVMLGNPRSRLDEFGKFIEPLKGWQSVTVDSEEWETTPKLDGVPGLCVRFDAEKSPNITMGQVVSRYLPTKERVEAARRGAGSENSPTYWSNERGFPPPEGLNKNVFTESQLVTHRAYERHQFTGERFMILGGLDPAFTTGGDRAMLRFVKMGWIKPEVFGIESAPPIQIKLNAKSNNPAGYQITEQVERECANVMCFGPGATGRGYVCPPEHLGVDATGAGAQLVDIMERRWSSKILRVEFGSAASEDACSHEDVRPAKEVYQNKRAEMWFRAADAVRTEQLKGIDLETAKELVTMEFDDEGRAKTVLMSKEDYRKKFGKSCDLADCLVICVEVARRLGFKLIAVGQTVYRAAEFDKVVAQIDAAYESIDYSEEELPSDEMDYAEEAVY